jgi:hypothetical protein
MNRPRLIRGIKISWTALCGIACVLLIALCVRSYWWIDSLQFQAGPRRCCFQSYVGRVTAFGGKDQTSPSFHLKSDLIVGQVARDVSLIAWERFGLLQRQPGASGVVLPFSALVLAAAVVAAASWFFPRRYTLRTMLIATTLIAVGLGIIVWLVR